MKNETWKRWVTWAKEAFEEPFQCTVLPAMIATMGGMQMSINLKMNDKEHAIKEKYDPDLRNFTRMKEALEEKMPRYFMLLSLEVVYVPLYPGSAAASAFVDEDGDRRWQLKIDIGR